MKKGNAELSPEQSIHGNGDVAVMACQAEPSRSSLI